MNFKNESKEAHALFFARLGKGYTVDTAYKLKGRKGSATQVMRTTSAPAGKRPAGGGQAGPPTGEIADVTKPLRPGDYVMLCPFTGKDSPTTSSGSSRSSGSSSQGEFVEAAGLRE